VTKDNNLLLTNVTKNTSLDCTVYWDDVHNTTFRHQINVIQQGTAILLSPNMLILLIPGNEVAVAVYPDSSKVTIDGGIYFVCVVNGLGHSYDIEWRFINQNVENSSLLTRSCVLNISSVQLNDSGSYYCIVRNGTKEILESTPGVLQVIGKNS